MNILTIEGTQLSINGEWITIQYHLSFWPPKKDFTVLEITQDIFENWLRDTEKLDDWIQYCKDHKLDETKAFELYKEDSKMNDIFEKDIFDYMNIVVLGMNHIEDALKETISTSPELNGFLVGMKQALKD